MTIYWGTETTVRLTETVDNRVIARQRKTQSLYLDSRFATQCIAMLGLSLHDSLAGILSWELILSQC